MKKLDSAWYVNCRLGKILKWKNFVCGASLNVPEMQVIVWLGMLFELFYGQKCEKLM